jgi:hypothetical protein
MALRPILIARTWRAYTQFGERSGERHGVDHEACECGQVEAPGYRAVEFLSRDVTSWILPVSPGFGSVHA